MNMMKSLIDAGILEIPLCLFWWRFVGMLLYHDEIDSALFFLADSKGIVCFLNSKGKLHLTAFVSTNNTDRTVILFKSPRNSGFEYERCSEFDQMTHSLYPNDKSKMDTQNGHNWKETSFAKNHWGGIHFQCLGCI